MLTEVNASILRSGVWSEGSKVTLFNLEGIRRGRRGALNGGIAQLVEHLLCKQGVAGSSPTTSTTWEQMSLIALFLGGESSIRSIAPPLPNRTRLAGLRFGERSRARERVRAKGNGPVAQLARAHD